MTRQDQLQETLCNRPFWHTTERNDAIVANHLFHSREMDVFYAIAMDEAILFDSLFNYLQEIQFFPPLEHLNPQKQRRKNYGQKQRFVSILLNTQIASLVFPGLSVLGSSSSAPERVCRLLSCSFSNPCRICWSWFTPNAKVKERQMTCGDAECQRERYPSKFKA
jgi:hypothetical protein